MVERALELVPAEALYEATGIQVLPINTLPQLLAEPPAVLDAAHALLLLPDLVAYLLTRRGRLRGAPTRRPRSSSTPRAGDWSWPVIDAVGLPRRLFGPVVAPGRELGPLRPELAAGSLLVRTTASHDTAAVERRRMEEAVRTQIAFYGSTRTYKAPLDLSGYGDLNAGSTS